MRRSGQKQSKQQQQPRQLTLLHALRAQLRLDELLVRQRGCFLVIRVHGRPADRGRRGELGELRDAGVEQVALRVARARAATAPRAGAAAVAPLRGRTGGLIHPPRPGRCAFASHLDRRAAPLELAT